MENQTLFNLAIAVAGFLGGWWLKVMWDAIKDMQKDLREIERELPEVYVRKDDFKDTVKDLREEMRTGFNKIDGLLNLIFNKLEKKEDK